MPEAEDAPEIGSDDEDAKPIDFRSFVGNEEIVHQGLLSKRAQQKRRITLRANVKDRWFLLTATSLSYFECKKNGDVGKRKGCIQLDSISAVEPLPAPEGSTLWFFEVFYLSYTF